MAPQWDFKDSASAKPSFLADSTVNVQYTKDKCFGVDNAEMAVPGGAADGVAHAGWVFKHDDGAGQVWYETLIAGGTMQTEFSDVDSTYTGDSAAAIAYDLEDDALFPDSGGA